MLSVLQKFLSVLLFHLTCKRIFLTFSNIINKKSNNYIKIMIILMMSII